jgi:hypothetical protein
LKGRKDIKKTKIKIMKNLVSAKIKTKSNYGNLNGKFYQVTQMVGTRVTCICEIDGRVVNVDFNLSEVVEFNFNNQ